MIRRIDAALPYINGEDERKLVYIRSQITPDGLLKREQNEHLDVTHLHEVAKSILKRYEATPAPEVAA